MTSVSPTRAARGNGKAAIGPSRQSKRSCAWLYLASCFAEARVGSWVLLWGAAAGRPRDKISIGTLCGGLPAKPCLLFGSGSPIKRSKHNLMIILHCVLPCPNTSCLCSCVLQSNRRTSNRARDKRLCSVVHRVSWFPSRLGSLPPWFPEGGESKLGGNWGARRVGLWKKQVWCHSGHGRE